MKQASFKKIIVLIWLLTSMNEYNRYTVVCTYVLVPTECILIPPPAPPYCTNFLDPVEGERN